MDKIDKLIARLRKLEKRLEKIEQMLPPDTSEPEEELDPLVPDAIQYILEKNSVSSAELQAHFDIGYARTMRILDELCELGFIAEFASGTDSQIIKKETKSPVQPPTEESRLVEAVKLTKNRKTLSTANLQRKLQISYTHAATLLDELEALGYIGPAQGSKPRIVIDKTKKNSITKN